MATRTKSSTIKKGATEQSDWGLGQLQGLIEAGYQPGTYVNPYSGGFNPEQEQVATDLGLLSDEYGVHWDDAQGIRKDISQMTPEEYAALDRRGGPDFGYFNPFVNYRLEGMDDDYYKSLRHMKDTVGYGAQGANAFGSTRHGAAEGVGGAEAMNKLLRAKGDVRADTWDKAMDYHYDDWKGNLEKTRLKNVTDLGYMDRWSKAANDMSNIDPQLSLLDTQYGIGTDRANLGYMSDIWEEGQHDKEQNWKKDMLTSYLTSINPGNYPTTETQTQTGGQSQADKNMGYASMFLAKLMYKCIPEGVMIDTPDGPVAIENLKAGMKVKGYSGGEVEILQKHQYKEDPLSKRFYEIKFDNGGTVNCCDMHKIYDKRAKDYKVGNSVKSHKITSITQYNGVERSYDLLTDDPGYMISGIPVNSMIEELSELMTEISKEITIEGYKKAA